jgi:tryptophan synthase alpha chain
MEGPANAHNVAVISMIAPTSESRIRMIAGQAQGFIYVVSSMGVTGVRSEIKTDLASIVESIRKVTDVPCAIGFGISTPEQAKEMAAVSDGAIVGSAIVKIIAKYGEDAAPEIYEYVKSMKAAVLEA